MVEQLAPKHKLAKYSLTILFLAMVFFEIVALILWVPGTWQERLTAVFAIISIYGLEIGFFSRSAAFASFRGALQDFTSSDIVEYVLAQFSIFAVVFLMIGAGFERRSPGSRIVPYAYYIELVILLPLGFAMLLFVLAYALFHILIVGMISYLPTVLASAIVERSLNSKFMVQRDSEKILISSILGKDRLASKGFLIGIPAALLSIISAIIAPFLG